MINFIKNLFPKKDVPKPIDGYFPKDCAFLKSNKASLALHHPNTFLLMKDGEKVGVYDTAEEALSDAFKKFKLGTFLVADSSSNVYISIKVELFQEDIK